MSSTLSIARSRSRSQCDFKFFLHLPQYSPISQLWCMLGSVIKYVCQSDNNIQDLLILSRLNDLSNC